MSHGMITRRKARENSERESAGTNVQADPVDANGVQTRLDEVLETASEGTVYAASDSAANCSGEAVDSAFIEELPSEDDVTMSADMAGTDKPTPRGNAVGLVQSNPTPTRSGDSRSAWSDGSTLIRIKVESVTPVLNFSSDSSN